MWLPRIQTPDEWAAQNREYGPETGWPGARDPHLTPYGVGFARAVAQRDHRRVVLVCAAQMGKTESMLDLIGERLDNRPAPILYVGPSSQFCEVQFEPRLVELFRQSASLGAKVLGGIDNRKNHSKSQKRVAGVRIRLAHAGSSTALKSDSVALALVDELDEMLANVRGQGDPLSLVEARGDAYADSVTAVTSTPSMGRVEIERDAASGLEFWAIGEEEDVTSPIWRLWQAGTRHHWAWPCPECGEFFVPRFRQLTWQKDATPAQAKRTAHLACPHCGSLIADEHKAAMNARGRYVAPGQRVARDGTVTGEPPDTGTLSFWVSGLASPFVSFGERAERYVDALRTNEVAKIQAATNAGFGEVYAPDIGDVPAWEEIQALALPYRAQDVPEGVILLTAGIDVQGNRLVFVIRGWGFRETSWLIHHGEIWGDTAQPAVWGELATLLRQMWDGLPVKFALVDSGFRPGVLPVNQVYEFCRRHQSFVRPAKGSSTVMVKPLVVSGIDVESDGKADTYGLELVRLDAGYWKSFVQERLRWPPDQPGAWHLHQDVDRNYLQQLVAEAPVTKPSGKVEWVVRSKDNHFLDAEALAAAAARFVGAQNIQVQSRSREVRSEEPRFAPPGSASAADKPAASEPNFERFARFAAQVNK